MTDKIDLAEYLKTNDKDDFEQLFDCAKDVYQLRLEQASVPTNTIQKIKAVEDFIKNCLDGMEDTIKKPFIKNDVAGHFGISRQDATGLISKYVTQPAKNKRKEVVAGCSYEGLYEIDESGKPRLIPQSVADHLIDKWKVVTYKEEVYIYKDGIYVPGNDIIKSEILSIAKDCGVKHGLRNISSDCFYTVQYTGPSTEYPFNTSDYIPVKNGVVKLDYESGEMELLPHSHIYKFNYKLKVDFVPGLENDYIHENVLSAYVEKKDIDVLYQIPAQALIQIRSDPFKKAYMIQGDPHAGKSTYLELLERVFGSDNQAGESLHKLHAVRFAAANLEGKLFNIYDDMSDVPMEDTGIFKTLTGKRTHSIERKGRDGYNAPLTAVHVFTCNSPPMFDSRIKHDTAFWERWEYINFPYNFPVDTTFTERTFTDENMSGFLNRILKTVIEIKKNGLLKNSDAGEIRDMWSYKADPLFQYLQDNVDPEKDHIFVLKEDLLKVITAWATAKDIDMGKIPNSPTGLTQSIDKYGVVATKTSDSTGISRNVYEIPGGWYDNAIFTANVVKTKKEQSKFGGI